MKYLTVSIILIIVLIVACEKPIFQTQYNAYIGNYLVSTVHHADNVPIYDSLGNEIGFEPKTFEKSDYNLVIEAGGKDTLVVKNLIRSNGTSTIHEAWAMVQKDKSLKFIYDFTDEYLVEYIKGSVWLEGDSIHIEYDWSFTWNAAPAPNTGSVRTRGIAL